MMDKKKAADLLDNLIGMIEDSGGRDYDTALKMGIEALTAQPDLDEWCTDCKEYDSECHCCPRFNRVIRETLKDMKDAQPDVARDIATIIENEKDMRVMLQPEIIRCRECVKRKICRTTTIWAVAPDDDWFCADAERREE